MAYRDTLTYTEQKRTRVKTFRNESDLSDFLEEHPTYEIANIFSRNETIVLVYIYYE